MLFAVCGEDRVIQQIEPAQRDLRSPFPEGTKHFYVRSTSSTCECESPCLWVDHVYWCADRSVVVQFSQLQTTLLGNVIRQLKGDS